jgi:4a-hydroxytetrahydrobiopterin dehydratase
MTAVASLEDLRHGRCRPLDESSRLDGAALTAQLAVLPGWAVADGALQRCFGFPDFQRTIGFVNALARMANAQDHHPDLQVSYARCTVRWSTHSSRGISLNDFICAALTDVLAAAGH